MRLPDHLSELDKQVGPQIRTWASWPCAHRPYTVAVVTPQVLGHLLDRKQPV
jgi:hypothetical protein